MTERESELEEKVKTLQRDLLKLKQADMGKSADLKLHIGHAELKLGQAIQEKTLDEIKSLLEGNGKPGVIRRLDRLERVLSLLQHIFWIIAGAIALAIGPNLASLLARMFKG